MFHLSYLRILLREIKLLKSSDEENTDSLLSSQPYAFSSRNEWDLKHKNEKNSFHSNKNSSRKNLSQTEIPENR